MSETLYTTHWKISSPFFFPSLGRSTANEGNFCPLPRLKRQLTFLAGGLLQGQSVIVIEGEPGAGKSSFALELRRHLPLRRVETLYLVPSPDELAHQSNRWLCSTLASAFKASQTSVAAKTGLHLDALGGPSLDLEVSGGWASVRAVLGAEAEANRHLVLFIELADNWQETLAREFCHLLDVASIVGLPLHLVLIGHPGLRHSVTAHAALAPRLSSHLPVEAWQPEEMRYFIQWLAKRHGIDNPLAHPRLVDTLWEVSHGIVGRLCLLGENALRLAAFEQSSALGEEHIRRAVTLTTSIDEALGPLTHLPPLRVANDSGDEGKSRRRRASLVLQD